MLLNARYFILLAWIFLPIVLFSQEINQRILDPKLNREILCGYCTLDGLKSGEFGAAYNTYFQVYEPDADVIKELRKLHSGAEILIILGTWCSDSEEQVPRFVKILNKIRFPEKNLTLICVDRDKQAGAVEISSLDITLIPTFIVYRNGREIGRIIEKPYQTLEEDLLMFLGDQ